MGRRAFFSEGDFAPEERVKLREIVALVGKGELLQRDYSAEEVAEMVGLKKRAILDMARRGEAFVHAYKPAHNKVRIPAADVVAFKLSRRIGGLAA